MYSAYHSLYSEAVVSSVASAVELAEVGRFREAVEYVQKAAKTLYEAAKDVFEHVKITVQRLVELFVDAVARVLAWVDEHKAYPYLMAAGVVALSVALNLWGLVELEKLAYAASLAPFVPAGVKEYSREEVFNILKNDPDPYEKFKEMARDANAGGIRLAEPWESLRALILPKKSEEERLMSGRGAGLYSKYLKDENYRRALFYAVLALEEAFGVYRTALGEYAKGLREAVQREEVVEGSFMRVRYVADLGQIKQLTENEEAAFKNALGTLRERLNEYARRYGVGDLNVEERKASELAEATAPELSRFSGVNFGVKAYAALIAYREHALGRRSPYGAAAWHWLEVSGSAWLLYYTPGTAYNEAEKTKAERPTAVGEMVTEALRRLFLKPGADRYRGFVELLRNGKLVLIFDRETESSYVFRLYNVKEGGKLDELGIELWISKVGEGEEAGITYTLIFDMSRWREFFVQWLEAAVKPAEEVGGRLLVEDLLLYKLGWVDSDVAITRRGNKRVLEMTTSHLWQLAETHALFGWSRVAGLRMNLTLEEPKLAVTVEAPLENLDETIRRSAESGWLKMLGTKAGLEDLMHVKSWDGLKRWVADHWGEVMGAVKRRLDGVKVGSGFDLARALEELERLKSRLDDDKIAREVVVPALLLIQAERLGVNEETLRYFAAMASSAIGGDGYVSVARIDVGLTSGKRTFALPWGTVLAAYGIKAEVGKARSAFQVIVSGGDAVKLARLYFLFGPPLLVGDDRFKNYKLAEAVRLGAGGALGVGWEGLKKTKGGRVAADLTISDSGVTVKYNVYLRKDNILLEFHSSNRSRVELAARLLKLAGVDAEVRKLEVGGKHVWYVWATTDKLAAGRKELRDSLVEIVREAIARGWVDAEKAEGWLEKLERGRVLKEGWPKYKVRLVKGGLEVRFGSTDRKSIEREKQRLKDVGLEEGKHFTVKMPKGNKKGYVYILREGLAHAAWLSVYGEGKQQRLAAEFVEYILWRAKEKGEKVYEKANKIIEEGKARGR
jgi:hypothetical protein